MFRHVLFCCFFYTNLFFSFFLSLLVLWSPNVKFSFFPVDPEDPDDKNSNLLLSLLPSADSCHFFSAASRSFRFFAHNASALFKRYFKGVGMGICITSRSDGDPLPLLTLLTLSG